MILVVLLLAAIAGVAVGTLGGGGSVLTVPILTYGLGTEPSAAIATSLFIVGVTSAMALLPHARAGRVRWGVGLLFGPAGMAGAYIGGRLGSVLPARALMTGFALMMGVSAWRMLRRGADDPVATPTSTPSLLRVIALGSLVGLVTGLVGAGGGFVIVPVLIFLVGLPIHAAVATSLLVIAMNCAAGLAGRIGEAEIDWPLTLILTAIAVAGSLVGGQLSGRIDQRALRRIFGWCVAAMAVFVLVRQAG